MWETSVESMRFGIAGYVVPFMFVYGSALLVGTTPWPETVPALLTGTLGTLALAAATIGYLIRKATVPERIALLAGSLLLIKPGLGTDLIGITLLVGVTVVQRFLRAPIPSPVQP